MKKILSLLIGILSVTGASAQLPDGSTAPDFTLTDINGNSWNLYTLLAQGKTVYIDISATWCPPCWSYHNSGVLESIYTKYGPNGTVAPNTAMVFLIEADPNTTLQDLQGTGSNTMGNWLQGIQYPVINPPASSQLTQFVNDYQVTGYPSLYRICTDKQTFFDAGTFSETQWLTTIDYCGLPLDAKIQFVTVPSPSCNTTITPSFRLFNQGSITLTSLTVNYDIDGANQQTYNWTGSLPMWGFYDLVLPPMPVTPGTHTFNISTANPNGGTDQNIINNVSNVNFTVLSNIPAQTTPVSEGFAANTFPPAGFAIINDDGQYTWSRQAVVGGFGNSTSSAVYNAFNNFQGLGTNDELLVPAVDLTNVNNPVLSFDVAYAAYSAMTFESEVLEVFVSDDCGTTWTSVYYGDGFSLPTAPDQTSPFTPAPGQWRTETINLSNYAGQNKVQVKFVITNYGANNLYLDNINLGAVTGTAEISPLNSLEVYPNPVSENTNLSFGLENDADVTVNIYSAEGALVSSLQLGKLQAGAQKISINASELGGGLYFIEVKAGEYSSTRKISVIK